MTNVTLETAPGAQIAFTGTRQLVYTFDDYRSSAQSVGGVTVGNGNLEYTVSLDATNSRHTYRGETYTSFNMPATITFGNMSGSTAGPVDRNLAFVYGPEHQRIKQTVTGGPKPGTTWYLNGEDSLGLSFEKELLASGITENKHYVSAGGVVFAMFVQRTGTLGSVAPTATNYFHHDHLGSMVAVSDEVGVVIERMAFDPWGKRRFVNGTPDVLDSIVGFNTDRGYTMHEHLDEMGIIHMNGRIYDPLIGRFMSADPFIQDPSSLQSYNRYAYVLNNPLAYTDPTGYFSLKKLFKAAAVVVVAIYAPQLLATYGVAGATVATATIVNAAVTGAIIGAISTGTLQGAVHGAFTGALFAAAGFAGTGEGISAKVASESTARYIAHAAAGCVSAEVGGEKCGTGAVAAVFGKYATNTIGDSSFLSSDLARGVASTVAGGVGSVIAGGKFENGAVTAAFGYLFNRMSEERRREWYRRNGWIDANGNPLPADAKALKKDLAALTDAGGAVVTLGAAACITFTPCAAGALTGAAIVGTGLSVVNSVVQSSPSSTFVDLAVDGAANRMPTWLRFWGQVAAEGIKKTDAVDNLKRSIDEKVK